jgi:hypothetical protein
VRRRGEGETVPGRWRAGAANEEEGEAGRRKKTGLTGGSHLSAGRRERRWGRWWSGPRGPEVGSWAAAERKGEGEESGPRAG